tara:strand:+ start:28910 stop:29059 length:150 start_codon:yes stop_codon:yes gene_type:complete
MAKKVEYRLWKRTKNLDVFYRDTKTKSFKVVKGESVNYYDSLKELYQNL